MANSRTMFQTSFLLMGIVLFQAPETTAVQPAATGAIPDDDALYHEAQARLASGQAAVEKVFAENPSWADREKAANELNQELSERYNQELSEHEQSPEYLEAMQKIALLGSTHNLKQKLPVFAELIGGRIFYPGRDTYYQPRVAGKAEAGNDAEVFVGAPGREARKRNEVPSGVTTVALKLLHPTSPTSPAGLKGDPVENVERGCSRMQDIEAALGKASDEGNFFAKCYHFGKTPASGRAYIFMNVAQHSLIDWERSQTVSETQVERTEETEQKPMQPITMDAPAAELPKATSALLGRQILRAIHVLHEKFGIVHMDFHPGNVMWNSAALSNSPSIQIVDWDFARKLDKSDAGRDVPPEVLRQLEYVELVRATMFAAGLLARERKFKVAAGFADAVAPEKMDALKTKFHGWSKRNDATEASVQDLWAFLKDCETVFGGDYIAKLAEKDLRKSGTTISSSVSGSSRKSGRWQVVVFLAALIISLSILALWVAVVCVRVGDSEPTGAERESESERLIDP